MLKNIVAEEPFATEWPQDQIFGKAFSIQGEVFREIKNRRTVRFSLQGKHYFVKTHRGVGWKEFFKNIFQFKLPVWGAGNEYRAIRHLEKLQIPTMHVRAFGERGNCRLFQESFLVTDEVTDRISLEDFCRDWAKNPPEESRKHALIRALAETVAKLHFSGLNHRDCYLCHFLLDQASLQEKTPRLTVMDLHRAEIRKAIPERLRRKDLAGIFFSSMDAGLCKRDALRFIAVYSRFGALPRNTWKKVLRSAIALYRKEFGRDPVL